MAIPSGATSYCPPVVPVQAGRFRGTALRHTVRPRGTRDWLLICTLAGAGLYRLPDGAAFRSRAGDATLFRPGAFQDYRPDPAAGWDLAYAHFLPRPAWPEWLDWPEVAPGLLRAAVADPERRRAVARRLGDAARLAGGAQPRREALALNALEEALLWCEAAVPRRDGDGGADPRVRRAAEELSRRLAQPFSEARLARAAGLSPSRLRHLFTAQMGVSPRAFQERLRMAEARRLLVFSRQTVSEIAAALGFESPFYFTTRFTRSAGESPRAFRKRAVGS